MTEICFCGWSGDMADKVLVMIGEGSGVLCCPQCGRLDTLDWLPLNARIALLHEAQERQVLREILGGVAA